MTESKIKCISYIRNIAHNFKRRCNISVTAHARGICCTKCNTSRNRTNHYNRDMCIFPQNYEHRIQGFCLTSHGCQGAIEIMHIAHFLLCLYSTEAVHAFKLTPFRMSKTNKIVFLAKRLTGRAFVER